MHIAAMAPNSGRWKVTKMEWLLFSDIIVWVQCGAVLFGTVLAAPLLSSLSQKHRENGFVCMAVGSMFSLLATASAELLVLSFANAFWFFSSLRGWWLLRSNSKINPLASTEATPIAAAEVVSKAVETVAEAITETAKTAVDAIQVENQPPDAA